MFLTGPSPCSPPQCSSPSSAPFFLHLSLQMEICSSSFSGDPGWLGATEHAALGQWAYHVWSPETGGPLAERSLAQKPRITNTFCKFHIITGNGMLAWICSETHTASQLTYFTWRKQNYLTVVMTPGLCSPNLRRRSCRGKGRPCASAVLGRKWGWISSEWDLRWFLLSSTLCILRQRQDKTRYSLVKVLMCFSVWLMIGDSLSGRWSQSQLIK